MDKVRIGVIGLGWFGETHVEAYRAVNNCEVVAGCTLESDRLTEICDKYNIKKRYSDFKEMLADPDIDMIDICTHAKDHAEPAVAALKSGKHVFLEKPLANTMEGINAIMDAAKDCKQNFMIGHICRFENDFAMAKEEIAAGRIGKIVSMYARRNVCAPMAWNQLINLPSILGDCIHDIDIMNWFCGAKAKKVFGMARRSNPDYPNTDVGWVNIMYDNDTVAVAESNWNMPVGSAFGIDARMEIIGTKGIVYLEVPSGSLIIDDGNKRQVCDSVHWPLINGERAGALHTELQYFVDCIIKGEKPSYVPVEDSYAAAKICIKALESSKIGEAVEL